MATKTCAVSASRTSESVARDDDRAQHVLILEAVDAVRQDAPIVLDQTTTHFCISRSTDPSPGQIAVHRSGLGWNLRAHGADCRLNGIPVEDVWLYDGDRLTLSGVEFRVRPATTDELLGHLPQTGNSSADEGSARMTEQDIAVAACERDLAEWEECLSDCEADLQLRTMRGARTESPVTMPLFDVDDRSRLAELQELRTNPAAFDGDRQRMQAWLETLQNERAALQQEREKLAAERDRLAERSLRATDDTVDISLPATIAANISPARPRLAAFTSLENEPGPIGMEWHVPRRDLEKSRMRLNSLRVVANRSTRRALARHFWRKQRSVVALKVALVAMSFALAGVLYSHHGVMESSTSALIWGAAAIGLITLSGLAHTWTVVNRLNAGVRPPTIETREQAESESPALLSGT